jgi:EAL domain-containing protein (putative c-di-GMP-specific phosphodiesterase class I)
MSENIASGTRRPPIPDDLGRALVSTLRSWRPQAFSLHDASGDTLWLSAGSIGPDEHNYVLSALDVFALEPQRSCIHRKLEDGRRALFLAARDPLGGCSGAGFAIIEGGPVDEARVVTPALRALLQRFSMLLAPPVDKRSILPEVAPEADSADTGLPDDTPIRARRYSRLQPGSGKRRYEVAIAPVGPQHDAAVFERVIDWLTQHRQQYVAKPSSFAVAISAGAALDQGFAGRVEACLQRSELDDGVAMLLVPAAAWAAQPARTLPLLEMCERRQCHVILDDFVLNDAALRLLQCKSIRMLKLETELTTAAMLERYPRALLSACTQISRVLGIHCIAKRVDSVAMSRWLAAAGIDYIDPGHLAEKSGATTSGQTPTLRQVS